MSRAPLMLIAAVLTVAAIALLFFVVPGRTTEIQKRGVKAEGQVLYKDSRAVQGRPVYVVRFVYADSLRKNHDVENEIASAADWDRLKPNQYITVYYLPDRPDVAYMPGAVGMVAPHSRALSFLGWSALIAAVPLWYLAFKAPKASRPPAPKGPLMARR
ncbi:MAG: hypothetical protein ACP5VE_07360 [Chthonomonadales bacterium]